VGKRSQASVEDEGFHVWTVRGGRVIRIDVFSEEHQTLEAAGLSERRVLACRIYSATSRPERDTERAMSEENVETVRSIWAALNEDPSRMLLEAFDEEAEIRNPPEFPLQGPFHGHEGVRIWAREVWEVFSGVHHEVEEVIDVGDGATVISVQRTQGRTRHMQFDTNLQWAGVFTFRGGKILRGQGYMSKAEALEAAGLSE
jgi:ketosteroid isomerase-like protein